MYSYAVQFWSLQNDCRISVHVHGTCFAPFVVPMNFLCSMMMVRYFTMGGLTTIKIVASQHTLANLPSLPEVVRERPQNFSNLRKKAYLEPLLM
jgi:hypothetical protein